MSIRRRKHWGWGFEDEQPSPEQVRAAASGLATHLGFPPIEVEDPVGLDALKLADPRIVPPAELAEICAADVHARASHALGKSYSDIVLGFRGHFEYPPDFVASPRDERDVERLLEWCAAERVAAIPYGGGTSVVGGVQPVVDSSYNGAISIDLAGLRQVVEVDEVSRAARIQGGATGPDLEAQLALHGLTLRHFPQSFELSTLGGWIATRAAGHFATVWTHIEDFVESVRAITPTGTWESRRLPGSGAGPSPDRLLVGSEGTLGVITEAWVRVQPRPMHRTSVGVRFPSFAIGAECVRALSQSGLHPSNCRLIDPAEARFTMSGDGTFALLVLGFESSDHPVGPSMDRALAICAEHGGLAGERRESSGSRGGVGAGAGGAEAGGAGIGSPKKDDAPRARGGAHETGNTSGAETGNTGGGVGAWREAFLRAPYVRDIFVAMGVLSETFETAITWDRFPGFHERVMAAARAAAEDTSGVAHVSCRFTHVYPDGPAPYYTVLAPAQRGAEVEQWAAIKAAVSEVIVAEGATITHHHAVGRDHRPWYDRQRPDPFAAALRGAKAAVDPQAVMNPGVLVDPLP
ncbi:MAG TPA: FAD-binding oxidoreductase [Solirubrobacteraceae bacterium]|nr:FAD-binding oxidoreductase [Solirubrobacteraceae bacterium]